MKPELLLYMFAIHGGHVRLFDQCLGEGIDEVGVFGSDLMGELPEHHKIISAVCPETIVAMIRGLDIFRHVQVIGKADCAKLNDRALVMIDEPASKTFHGQYFPYATVEYRSVFLQWNKERVFSQVPVNADTRISQSTFDQKIMQLAEQEGAKSSDWWRHVGAMVFKDNKVLLGTYNAHLPSAHTPYLFGDPRIFTEAGKDPHICGAIHAEQALIAEAAKRGLSLKDADLYVTTFPCPVCAKIVGRTGIRRVFFRDGHASLDGEMILKSYGIEIIHVQ